MPRLSLNSFREEAIALVAGLAVFAVYYPLAVWVHRDFVSTGRPEGKLVELILKFEESADGGYQAQVYGSSSYQKGILYEDLTRLEEVEIRELPFGIARDLFYGLAGVAGAISAGDMVHRILERLSPGCRRCRFAALPRR